MVTALALLLTACLVQGALGGSGWMVSLPKTIEVLNGSCVTIPCSFDVPDRRESHLDQTCRAVWHIGSNVLFRSSGPQATIQGKLNGDLMSKDCTTTLNDMKPEYNGDYILRMECNYLKYSYTNPKVQISVKADPQRPTLTPSTLKVTEGTSVSLTCSAPAPCLSLPPTLTWTPGLGESQETLEENQDKTKVKTSVLNFTASHLHNRLEISCTAVYRKQGGSTESSVNSSLTAQITYPPKDTTVSVSPSGPVKENTNVTLTCSSNANPVVKNYTWFRADGGLEDVIGTGQTLRFKASTDSDLVFCKTENELGAGRSNNTQIDVQYPPKDTTVSVSPSGPVKGDTNVTLTCSSNANPVVKNYTWFRADRGLEDVIGTGRVFNIQASKVSDPVFCKAENELGAGRSNNTQIDIQYPPQILPSSDCTKTVDQLNCSCTTSGNPAPTLDWYMDGSPANNSDSLVVGYEPKDGTGVGFMAVSQAQWKDQFTLLCRSSNSLGSAAQRFYFFLEPQTSAGSRDSVIVPILIAIVVALLVLVCALLFVIRTQKSHQNLIKSRCSGNGSTIGVSQLLPSGEGNTLVKSKDEDIYVNTIELKVPDVTKPATPSEPKSPSSGPNKPEEERNTSGETNTESKEIIYSNVTWRSKNTQKEEGEGANTEGRLSRGFMNKAVEMGNQYEVEPRNKQGKTECEYAQVKFKEKSEATD